MAKLIYVYDPMCSWCWGYRESWLKLREALGDKLAIEYKVGGSFSYRVGRKSSSAVTFKERFRMVT